MHPCPFIKGCKPPAMMLELNDAYKIPKQSWRWPQMGPVWTKLQETKSVHVDSHWNRKWSWMKSLKRHRVARLNFLDKAPWGPGQSNRGHDGVPMPGFMMTQHYWGQRTKCISNLPKRTLKRQKNQNRGSRNWKRYVNKLKMTVTLKEKSW